MLNFKLANSLPSGEKAGRPSSTDVSATCSIAMRGLPRGEILGCGAKVVESQQKVATLLA